MAKLLTLVNGFHATIAAAQGPAILRDIHRNDIVARRYAYLGDDSASPGAEDSGTLSAVTNSIKNVDSIGAYHMDAAVTDGNECEAVTIEKSAGGYKIAVPGVANLDTPAKCAAFAYGDASRTTFNSFQDFVRLVQANEAFHDEIASGMTSSTNIYAVVLDQVAESAHLVGNSYSTTDPTFTHIATVQFDESVSVQYGE